MPEITSTNYYYTTNFTYNSSSRTYTLTGASKKLWSSNYSSLKGYYTCGSESLTSCTNIRYIVGTSASSMDYLELTGGLAGNNTTEIFSKKVEYRNGKYYLSTASSDILYRKDFYDNYRDYEGAYLCYWDYSNSCDRVYYIYFNDLYRPSVIEMSNGETKETLEAQANAIKWKFGKSASYNS